MREAVINAIKHGNQMDERKTLKVAMSSGRRGCVTVRDQNGLNERRGSRYQNCSDEGRGLLLMKTFVDRVEVRRIDQQGTEVSLTKLARESTAKRRQE